VAGMAKKRDQDPGVEDVASDRSANDRTLADPLYTHSADRPPPQAHSGAKVEAPLGSYNFPLASVRAEDEPPPPANPWALAMVRKEQSA
jgi:hypothetical protein